MMSFVSIPVIKMADFTAVAFRPLLCRNYTTNLAVPKTVCLYKVRRNVPSGCVYNPSCTFWRMNDKGTHSESSTPAVVSISRHFFSSWSNRDRVLKEIWIHKWPVLVQLSCCNYSVRRKDYKFPELRPEDLEENFVRGSGPGGQAVNQTANCVVLKHIPTGIVVKCQATRSLQENRKQAKKLLEEKLDLEMHGEDSYLGQLKQDKMEGKIEKKKRARAKLALKKAFKDREGIE
ncbi:probable peptide chain release factor C12orf65 homolog, mitochondrial [Aplysia californica]|uniref:Probable peptide chain release factor C12orf65 homolog, mitochondrial n=1 Tax=Aplysia californica TaxID=6500 RepID=A0ABM1VSH0_APLCA|nr:probable peptide chain release factor C12orf65 homolog, mitochondrial [Aplysia californica]